MDTKIFSEVDKYICNLLAPEDKVLTETIKSLDKDLIPNGLSSPSWWLIEW